MTDQDRANKAKELLEQAKDLLAGLDSELDPLVSDFQEDIQEIIDSIELELGFAIDGSLEPADDDDFDEDGNPFDDFDDDEEDDEDDEDFD